MIAEEDHLVDEVRLASAGVPETDGKGGGVRRDDCYRRWPMESSVVVIGARELSTTLEQVVRRVLEEHGSREPDGWLSQKSAAGYLDTTEEAIKAATARGQLPVHRGVTGRRRYRRSEIDQFAVANDKEA